jgi:hypothetical protein
MEGAMAARLSFDDLVASPPYIHNARARTWGIAHRLAEFLDQHVERGFVTLETGSGLSTLVILRRGVARHIAITPETDEFAVIREFCAQHDIPTAAFEPVPRGSEEFLPSTSLPALNLVLVDGNHAFPLPFIDWYYTADQLVVGGLMIIDDIQLITGRLLADFMDADPKWERVLYEERRFAVFRKVQHPIHKGGWTGQPYVVDSNPVHQINIVRAAPAPGSRPVYKAFAAVCAHLPPSAQALYRRLRRALREE